jgi:hypothetical protein
MKSPGKANRILVAKKKITCVVVHYGKNCRCCARNHCREPLHSKEIFAVRTNKHARQRQITRQLFRAAHSKEQLHGILRSGARQRSSARQSLSSTHDKETHHGKDPAHRTAKKSCTVKGLDVAVVLPLPCGQTKCTAKAPLPCDSFFAVRHDSFYLFFFLFYFI